MCPKYVQICILLRYNFRPNSPFFFSAIINTDSSKEEEIENQTCLRHSCKGKVDHLTPIKVLPGWCFLKLIRISEKLDA